MRLPATKVAGHIGEGRDQAGAAQRVEPDHAGQDAGEHELEHGHIREAELAGNAAIFGETALVQRKAKTHAEQERHE